MNDVIWITGFPNPKRPRGQRTAIGWADIDEVFEDACTEVRKSKKDLPLIKLATFKGDHRANEDIEAVYGIEADYDEGKVSIAEAKELLKAANVECLIYPSVGWTPEKPRWRVLAPLSQPLLVGDYNNWGELAEARNRLLARLNGVLGGKLAGESSVLSQAYYLGWVEGGHRLTHSKIEGQRIDDLRGLDEGCIWVEYQGGGKSGESNREDDLALDTELVDKHGEVRMLREWLPEVKAEGEDYKQLFQASPWRPESQSMNAFMRIVDGRPFVHDNGTAITHWLRVEDWEECDAILGNSAPAKVDLQTFKEQTVIGEALNVGRGIEMTYNEMLRHLIHLRQGDRVLFDFNPRCVYTSPIMEKVLAGNLMSNGRTQAFKAWQNDLRRKQMDTVTFMAGGPPALLDPDGLQAVNTWLALYRSEISPKDAERESAVFASHVFWLFGDRAHDFLDWLAHIEQNPGELPHTAWLHISPNEGTGRSWLGNVLQRLWNPYVAPSLDLASLMESQFNQKLAGKLLAIVEEIKEGGTNQWAHRQRFKQWMTEEVRTINVKHQHEYKEFNRCRWLLFSNHESAIPLDEFDRRVEVVSCHEMPKHEDYYSQLYGLLEDRRFIASIAVWLRNRDLTGFNPGRPAKKTAAKMQLVRTSQKREDRVIEAIRNHWPYDIITVATVMGALTGHDYAVHAGREAVKYKVYLNKLTYWGECQMTVLDYERVDGKKKRVKRRKKHTIYLVNNINEYLASDKDIRLEVEHYDEETIRFEGRKKGRAWLEDEMWKQKFHGFPKDRAAGIAFAAQYVDEEDV